MAKDFQSVFKSVKKATNRIILPVGLVLLICSLMFGGVGLYMSALLLIAFGVAVNCVWFVPTGCVGYKRVFTKLVDKSYKDGINWVIPFITDTYLMDVTQITRYISDTKKVKTRNNIELDCTLTYEVDERYAHLLFQKMKENYFETHLSKWIDATFDTIVSQCNYAQFQCQKDKIERIVSCLIAEDIDKRCSALSKDLVPTSHKAKRYDVVTVTESIANPDKDPANPAHNTMPDFIVVPVMERLEIGADEVEYVPLLDLTEREEEVDGVNFFKSIDLKINRVAFEATYEAARAKVAVAKAQTAEANEKKKQTEILAEANKIARLKEGEAEAEYLIKVKEAEAAGMRLTLASENDARERLGEIIMRYPGVLKETLAKNFPKVFGGNTMVNLDNMLGGQSIIKP